MAAGDHITTAGKEGRSLAAFLCKASSQFLLYTKSNE
jgi:hypothetical protein